MSPAHARVLTLLEVAEEMMQQIDIATEIAEFKPSWKRQAHELALAIRRFQLDSFDPKFRGDALPRRRKAKP